MQLLEWMGYLKLRSTLYWYYSIRTVIVTPPLFKYHFLAANFSKLLFVCYNEDQPTVETSQKKIYSQTSLYWSQGTEKKLRDIQWFKIFRLKYLKKKEFKLLNHFDNGIWDISVRDCKVQKYLHINSQNVSMIRYFW